MALSQKSIDKIKAHQNPRPFAPQQAHPVRRFKDLPATHTIGVDGVDHINTWYGGTALGRQMAMAHPHQFRHPVYGSFISVEAFYFWIASPERPDRLRWMNHNQLVSHRRSDGNSRVINIKALTMDAVWVMLEQTPELAELVKNKKKEVRFDHYRTEPNGLRVRSPWSTWWVLGLEEIARALRGNRKPNFGFLMDPGSTWIYEDAKDWYIPPPPTPEPTDETPTPPPDVETPVAGAADIEPPQDVLQEQTSSPEEAVIDIQS